MNLVQQDTVYNYKTYELLESMIELSRINIDRFQGMDRVGEVNQLRFGMTGFDTGRQTGKSTAIARYAKENDCIVVSPTKMLQKIMTERLQSVNNFNLCVGDFCNTRIFRGVRREFDLIFNECSIKDIFFCIDRLGIRPNIKVRSIVKVGT